MARWLNFRRHEFSCSHCGENKIKNAHIDVLQDIRTEVGFPLRITSGYRCKDHPIEAKKAVPGEHNDGSASDISVSHQSAFEVLQAAFAHPEVTGLGINQRGRKRFIHIGTGPEKPGRPRPTVWSY